MAIGTFTPPKHWEDWCLSRTFPEPSFSASDCPGPAHSAGLFLCVATALDAEEYL